MFYFDLLLFFLRFTVEYGFDRVYMCTAEVKVWNFKILSYQFTSSYAIFFFFEIFAESRLEEIWM